MFQVHINGERREIPEGLTVLGLLDLLELPHAKVAVERNLEIVPKSTFESVTIENGDRLEIVHFIGGG